MNAIKVTLLMSLFLFVQIGNTNAQEDTTVDIAVEKMSKAAVDGDVTGLMRYMSPRLIEGMGGKESAFTLLNEANAKLKGDGLKIDTVINFNKFAVFDREEVHYKYYPQLIIMSIPDTAKKMIALTSVLAMQGKASSGWSFIDLSNLNEASMQRLLPEFEEGTFPKLADKPLVIPKEDVPEAIDYLLNLMDKLFTESEKIEDQP